MLSKRLRRKSNSHLVNGVTYNGVEAFKRMCNTYLPQEKVDALLCQLHKNFEQLKLIRVKDEHSFFTTVGWYVRAYNKLATTTTQRWDKATVSKLVINLLSHSRHAIKGENGSNLITVLANIQSGAKLMDIKEGLYHPTPRRSWKTAPPIFQMDSSRTTPMLATMRRTCSKSTRVKTHRLWHRPWWISKRHGP